MAPTRRTSSPTTRRAKGQRSGPGQIALARAFLRELTHILQAIFSALLRRESPYASVLAAVLELAGEKAQAVKIPDEPGLDETWEEPAVFGGCSTQGQASPGQPQPIQIVRAAARQASTQPGASA